MAHVSNQAQLAAALCRQEPSIQITADFPLTSQLNILYDRKSCAVFPSYAVQGSGL